MNHWLKTKKTRNKCCNAIYQERRMNPIFLSSFQQNLHYVYKSVYHIHTHENTMYVHMCVNVNMYMHVSVIHTCVCIYVFTVQFTI